MNAFNTFMEAKFMPIAAKIGSQKHLAAVRDSFIAIMPITMVGSIAVLLNVLLRDLPGQAGMDGFVKAMTPISNINGNVYFGSIVILSLAFVFALGYNLSKTYNVNAVAGGVNCVKSCLPDSVADCPAHMQQDHPEVYPYAGSIQVSEFSES